MFRRNSIFTKILIPVMTVMLLQIGIIGLVLYVNGTITTLEDAATAALARNSENRGTTLEQMMVNYWSNLDRLEMSVIERVDAYLNATGITIMEALGDYEHETNMLESMSQPMIDALRMGAPTGIFMLFLDKEGLRETVQERNGLYYRDFNPLSNPADNSDILFLKGYIDIARKDRIQLDGLWSEVFTFDPKDEDLWKGFANPQKAYAQYPEASSIDLAYWNGPHLQNPKSVLDSNKCITYTRPVIYKGQIIALIGAEIQVVQLEKYFPAVDFEKDSQSGYMLISYDAGRSGAQRSSIYHITGSYVRRIIGSEGEIAITPTNRDGIYTIESETISEGVLLARYPIRLYNQNAPYSNEQWALAAIGTDRMLFSTSRSVSVGIMLSGVLTLVFGIAVLLITVRRATKPLISIADQIEESGRRNGEWQSFQTDSNTYEVNLLCSTLNLMNERRNLAEALVREERQRYLVALESAADTFMEYDVKQDNFMLYYFTGGNESMLSSKIIGNFSHAISQGEICHPDDTRRLFDFLWHIEIATIEIRVRTSVFSHISGTEPDGGYYWFMIKASNVIDNEGNISKIIGTAKEITREKLEALAKDEALRRDPATKFYNRDYGILAVKQAITDAGEHNTPILLCLLQVKNFDKLESYYGRVFGAFVMMELRRAMSHVITHSDIAVRLSNDDFLICLQGVEQGEAKAKMVMIENTVKSLYTGENTNITISAGVKTVKSVDEIDKDYSNKPISILLDVDKSNIVSSTFDLFERTSHIRSSINMLLGFLGNIYDLSRIAIYSFDAGFGSSQIAYQWARAGLQPFHGGIDSISHADTADFEALLDENETMVYSNESAEGLSEGVRKLLFNYETYGSKKIPFSAYCCVMRDGEAHIGRVLFISDNPHKQWPEAECRDLCDIVKIISSNIAIERSRSASRAKSEFLSRISHEIRTPMNTIIGMTDIAKSVINDPIRLNESLNHIDFSAKHLLTLINDVLEMSRIESGKLRIENKPFSLDELVSGVETLMRFPIESKGISFTVNKDYSHNRVIGDEYRLRQVIMNFLGNAGKFTESGGAITFSIKQQSGAHLRTTDADSKRFGIYLFSVVDNGIGINPEDQPVVFEAFGQAASLPAGQQQGTGLGLAISESIVSAMGGKIEVDSKPGEGSDFHFAISLELCEESYLQPVSESDTIDYKGCFAGKRALLVDDVASNIAVATFDLEITGIGIEVAHNGREAVDMFFKSDAWYYDIIFMDVKMPVMDGITATRMIRAGKNRPDARFVPIVAMTANAYDEDLEKTVESGMNGHITKPIVKKELYKLMAKLLTN